MQDNEEIRELLQKRIASAGGIFTRPMQEAVIATLEQVDQYSRVLKNPSTVLLEKNPPVYIDHLPTGATVACQGVSGAYSHSACEQLFQNPNIQFYTQFEDVFTSVSSGEMQFGVLPVENSSAGQVSAVLELVSKYNLYVNSMVQIHIAHCLCTHPDTPPENIREVLSHPQALAQCKSFIKSKGYTPQEYTNTAAAAKHVSEKQTDFACICSKRSAQMYGLKILACDVQDFDENYTRFVCVSKQNLLLPEADTVSITISFPNQAGALGRILTRFSLCSLDLTRIASMPIASKDFNVRFHLDFRGNIQDMGVVLLLSSIYEEGFDFQFLGNYRLTQAVEQDWGEVI